MLKSLSKKLHGSGSTNYRRQQPFRRRHLEVEVLEDRCVPATVVRPISDFVDQQGTFCLDDGQGGCFLFVPPVENFFGWVDPAKGVAVSVDYAGLANKYVEENTDISFGTTFQGNVVERELADGRAEVFVTLHTKNALTWAIPFDVSNMEANQFGENELIFGARVPDIIAGAEPALGESFLQVKFIVPEPGATLPDLQQLAFAPEEGQEFPIFLSFRARANGELREAFGVEDGTPGRVITSQTGLFMTSFKGATEDAFPAELINIGVVGNGTAKKGGQGQSNSANSIAAIDAFFAALQVVDEDDDSGNGKRR